MQRNFLPLARCNGQNLRIGALRLAHGEHVKLDLALHNYA